jgi:hypothetical protein
MGVPVETRKIRLEAKCIFGEQNPENFPTQAHIAIHGDDDVEYPLKLSNKWMESFLYRHNFSFHKFATKMNKQAVPESSLDVIKSTISHYKLNNSWKK